MWSPSLPDVVEIMKQENPLRVPEPAIILVHESLRDPYLPGSSHLGIVIIVRNNYFLFQKTKSDIWRRGSTEKLYFFRFLPHRSLRSGMWASGLSDLITLQLSTGAIFQHWIPNPNPGLLLLSGSQKPLLHVPEMSWGPEMTAATWSPVASPLSLD